MISDKKKGFTLVETLVVIVIIVILSLIILPNYNSIKEQLSFQRSASKLAQDIRVVQEMAMSAEELGGATPLGGYGISLLSRTFYTIFIDSDGDGRYDNPAEKVEDIFLEDGIEIDNVSPALDAIVFFPPDPKVFFMNPGGNDIVGADNITIDVIVSGDPSKKIEIIINRAGLIDIN